MNVIVTNINIFINILFVIVIILLLIVIAIAIYFNRPDFFQNKSGFVIPPFKTKVQPFTNTFTNTFTKPTFRAPPSLTSLKDSVQSNSKTKIKGNENNYNRYLENVIKEYNKGRSEETEKKTIYDVLHDIAHHDILGFHTHHLSQKKLPKNHLHYEKGNLLTMPTFFDSRDKWPGCIPPASYQGTCGSCWAFAICQCLSSRIYIESCGYGGCNSYPQLNLKSLDLAENNINAIYKYKSITLSNIHKFINQSDVDEKKPSVTIDEWLSAVKRAHKIILSDTSKALERFQAMQTIVYMLDFQSLGSIKFNKKNENLEELLYRAKKVFRYVSDESKEIDVLGWQTQFLAQPIPLSPEKLISCCYPNCYERGKFDLSKQETIEKGTPQCVGSTLVDGWKVVRSVGTTSAICIGYNLDSWEDGDFTPGCHELQGPNYEYCSGFSLTLGLWNKEIEDELYTYEKNKLNPVTETNPLVDKIPWVYPQTFKFFAKNSYEVNNNVTDIQNEIIQRGPVTTGFIVYPDFQDRFGSSGMGGQLYKPGTDPLGSSAESLIYMWDGKGEPVGGHAITIVGWGTFKDQNDLFIPYWICLNSWGREWGTNGYPSAERRESYPTKLNEGGYFWMVRGINNCGIENNVCAGQPNIGNVSYPGIIEKYGWGAAYPDLSNVKLIPESHELKLPDINVKFDYLLNGGGSYINNLGNNRWEVKAMTPPSPFVMFWPEERPLYCMGKTTKDISKNDTNIYIDDDTFLSIRMVIKVIEFPILVINDEQLQLTNTSIFYTTKVKSIRNNEKFIQVNRGLNRSSSQNHTKGSLVKIFPYKDLSIQKLENMNFKKCEKVFLDTVIETSNMAEVCNKLQYSKKLLGE